MTSIVRNYSNQTVFSVFCFRPPASVESVQWASSNSVCQITRKSALSPILSEIKVWRLLSSLWDLGKSSRYSRWCNNRSLKVSFRRVASGRFLQGDWLLMIPNCLCWMENSPACITARRWSDGWLHFLNISSGYICLLHYIYSSVFCFFSRVLWVTQVVKSAIKSGEGTGGWASNIISVPRAQGLVSRGLIS